MLRKFILNENEKSKVIKFEVELEEGENKEHAIQRLEEAVVAYTQPTSFRSFFIYKPVDKFGPDFYTRLVVES